MDWGALGILLLATLWGALVTWRLLARAHLWLATSTGPHLTGGRLFQLVCGVVALLAIWAYVATGYRFGATTALAWVNAHRWAVVVALAANMLFFAYAA